MKNILLLISIIFIAACSSTKSQFSSGAGKTKLPSYTEVTLSNGLKLMFIPDRELPRISMAALVKVGAVNDPEKLPGLTALTSGLLDEGTQKNSAMELAAKLEFLGASLAVTPGVDFTTVSAEGLSQSKEELLTYFSEVLMQPSFNENEIKRVRSQVLAGLKKMSDEPDEYTSAVWDLTVFGPNAYGFPISGTTASVEKIKKADISRHYLKYFRPGNTMIAITGHFDSKFEEQVKQAFSTWSAREVEPVKLTVNELPKSAQIFLATQPGLKQTQIRMGWSPSISRNDPDFLRLRVANMVLGGAFASRLNQVVRDDKGLTYGIYSYFDVRKFAGAFVVDTFTRNDKVADTISATQETVNKFAKDGITESELAASKSVLIGQFPKTLETIDRIAFNLLVLRFYGIGDDYLTNYVQNINAFNLKEINAAITKHFKPELMQTVVYGDSAVIKSQLVKLGSVVPAPVVK